MGVVHEHHDHPAGNGRLARVGELASLACAVHCAAMPVLIGASAAGALSFLREEPVEWAMVGVAAVVGSWAAWRGYRAHRNPAVAAVLLLAVLGLVAHALHLFDDAGHEAVHSDGIAWSGVLSGATLAVALFVNNRLTRSCRSCARGHDHDAGPAAA